ncbi:MAG: CBS domain-containing protein [Gammaproteobacteria bacterium]|jgi:CBS domain-containing protein|nr:MAG: CBS domain-containing protein [Gammaproteobacteria bacterium]
MKINELMTARVETIAPGATVKDAARTMHDLHIGSLPVVENGQLVGIITDRDICCRVVATGRDAVMTQVKEIMVKDVTTCFDDQDLADAARLMTDHHIRRLAVLKRDNSMAGFLSVEDLARGSHDLASSVLEASTPAH